MSDLSENLQRVQERIDAATARAGRPAESVDLIAVSKTHPPDVIRELARAHHTLFGESRVQEILAKAPELSSSLRWHFIGHLQKNKVRRLLPWVEAIHSVESLSLAEDIDRIAAEEGRRPDIYLQVNVAEDTAKFGFTRDSVRRDLDAILALPRLNLLGLMTIPALTDDPEKSRPAFAALRELRDSLQQSSGIPLPGLSMGMSDDYEIAIEEGATIVRVGSALFGRRQPVIAPQRGDFD
ncbi:MAG: YggS family pyridoxal phosphate-dependent enzyme [Verrucomicrobiales bacterium]